MNNNEFAKIITLTEGKKVSQSIAQVKEVIKLIKEEVSQWSDAEILKFFRKKSKKK